MGKEERHQVSPLVGRLYYLAFAAAGGIFGLLPPFFLANALPEHSRIFACFLPWSVLAGLIGGLALAVGLRGRIELGGGQRAIIIIALLASLSSCCSFQFIQGIVSRLQAARVIKGFSERGFPQEPINFSWWPVVLSGILCSGVFLAFVAVTVYWLRMNGGEEKNRQQPTL